MSEVQLFHRVLLRQRPGICSAVALAPRPIATQSMSVAADPSPVLLEEPVAADDGLQVHLTPESRDNIQRAPSGTRFYCVADAEGTTHCAASHRRTALDDSQKSSLGGTRMEPIVPSSSGTGHQQVARAAGLAFDEQTARVGYVDGEGFGLSIEKVSDCERNYSFRSAFNRQHNPTGGREMPAAMADRFEQDIENAFPACAIRDTAD